MNRIRSFLPSINAKTIEFRDINMTKPFSLTLEHCKGMSIDTGGKYDGVVTVRVFHEGQEVAVFTVDFKQGKTTKKDMDLRKGIGTSWERTPLPPRFKVVTTRSDWKLSGAELMPGNATFQITAAAQFGGWIKSVLVEHKAHKPVWRPSERLAGKE